MTDKILQEIADRAAKLLHGDTSLHESWSLGKKLAAKDVPLLLSELQKAREDSKRLRAGLELVQTMSGNALFNLRQSLKDDEHRVKPAFANIEHAARQALSPAPVGEEGL